MALGGGPCVSSTVTHNSFISCHTCLSKVVKGTEEPRWPHTQEQCGVGGPLRPFLRLNGGCAWRECREAEGKLVFRVSSVTLKLFKECLGLLNVPLLLSKAGILHKGGSCPAQAPSGKKSHCPGAGPPSRRCMLHCPPHSGLSARISRDSRLNVLRYFMSRAAAGSGQNQCLLLSAELFYLHF